MSPRKPASTAWNRSRSSFGSLHAAEHAMIAVLPLWAMCDRWDIGGLSDEPPLPDGCPTVFVYDGHPGGVGIARRGYDELEGWSAIRSTCSPAVRAPTAVPPASSPRSAAT